jgi:cell wall-associated NlpC family hydrolase
MNPLLRAAGLALTLLLAACATQLQPQEGDVLPRLGMQSPALHPGNGGQLVTGEALQPGDIVLTAANSFNSLGLQLATGAPVSHAALYLGRQQVAEAVGEGIRQRTLADLLAEESTVVAFRHPGVKPEHLAGMERFVHQHLGQKYNYMGIVLQAPFTLERRVCELPLVPSLVRDFCIRGVAAVQLGLGTNDRFFCSQFVMEAYRSAGLPLTDADPRLINPADLLHMREGDVPSVRIHQPLLYVGHLKSPVQTVVLNGNAQ